MKTVLWFVPVGLALAGSLLALEIARGGASDCPGTIICPITGQEICRDQCPLVDSERPNCPATIECPLGGELVCRDRCPLTKDATADAAPACCQHPFAGR